MPVRVSSASPSSIVSANRCIMTRPSAVKRSPCSSAAWRDRSRLRFACTPWGVRAGHVSSSAIATSYCASVRAAMTLLSAITAGSFEGETRFFFICAPPGRNESS